MTTVAPAGVPDSLSAVVPGGGPLACEIAHDRFLHLGLMHVLRLKTTALALAALCVPVVYIAALAWTDLAQRVVDNGGDVSQSVGSGQGFVDLLRTAGASGARTRLCVLWVVSNVVTWVTIMYWIAMGPLRMGKRLSWGFYAFAGLSMVGNSLITIAWTLGQFDGLLAAFLTGTLSFYVAGHLVARTEDYSFPRCTTIIAAHLFVTTTGLLLYFFVIPPAFFGGSDGQRLLVRLVLHPLIVEWSQIPARLYTRLYPGATTETGAFVMFITLFVTNLFGRFMAAGLLTSWGTAVCVAVIPVQEVFLRLTLLHRDELLYAPFMGRAAAKEFCRRSQRSLLLKAEANVADQITEDVAIAVSAAIYIFFRLSLDEGQVDAEAVLWSAVAQAALELLADLTPVLVVYTRLRHSPVMEVRSRWRRQLRYVVMQATLWKARWTSRASFAAVSAAAVGFTLYVIKSFLSPCYVICVRSFDAEGAAEWVPCP